MAETKVLATVEFVIGSEPVRGRIIRVGAGDASFVGWLGLLGLLEQAASQQTSEPLVGTPAETRQIGARR